MNHSATTANAGMKAPREAYYGSPPELTFLVIFQPGYMRVMWDQQSQPQAVTCYFLTGSYSHPSDCLKVLEASTGAIGYTREVTWPHAHTPLVVPPQPAGRGSTSSAAVPTPPEKPDVWYAAAPPSVESPPYRVAAAAFTVFQTSAAAAAASTAVWFPGATPATAYRVFACCVIEGNARRYPSMLSGSFGICGRCGCRGVRETRTGLSASKRDCKRVSRIKLSVATLGSVVTMGRTAFVSMMAGYEEFEDALRDDRPPHDPPNMSMYPASNRLTPTSFAGAMVSGQAPRWCDSMSRGILNIYAGCGYLRGGEGIDIS